MLFLVLANDAGDPAVMDRRMANRAKHAEAMNVTRDNGQCRFGAAMLDDHGQMCGSAMVLDMPDVAAVNEWLKSEPYVTGDVWGDVRIVPLKVGPSFEEQFKSQYEQEAA